jgi:hypothetical protein
VTVRYYYFLLSQLIEGDEGLFSSSPSEEDEIPGDVYGPFVRATGIGATLRYKAGRLEYTRKRHDPSDR